VRHEEPRAGRRDALQELAAALSVGLTVAARGGQHDRFRTAAAERLVQRRADTLSCDHRVVDGARGAQFLDTLAQLIQEPLNLLD
jgi:hypothetical protein